MPPSYPGGIAPGLPRSQDDASNGALPPGCRSVSRPLTRASLRSLAQLCQYRRANRLWRGLEGAKHAGGRLVGRPGQAEQQVLAADLLVAQRDRLPEAQLQRLLRLPGERELAAPARGSAVQRAGAERLLDTAADCLEVDADALQRLGFGGAETPGEPLGGQLALDRLGGDAELGVKEHAGQSPERPRRLGGSRRPRPGPSGGGCRAAWRRRPCASGRRGSWSAPARRTPRG